MGSFAAFGKRTVCVDSGNICNFKNHIKSFHAAALMSAEKLTPQYVAEGDAWPIALSCQNIVFTYPHNNNSDYNMLYAYSANACFAIELRLKLVIFLETNEWAVVRKCGHNLVSLMERISPESKKIMRAAFDEEKKKTKEFYSEPQKKKKKKVFFLTPKKKKKKKKKK